MSGTLISLYTLCCLNALLLRHSAHTQLPLFRLLELHSVCEASRDSNAAMRAKEEVMYEVKAALKVSHILEGSWL